MTGAIVLGGADVGVDESIMYIYFSTLYNADMYSCLKMLNRKLSHPTSSILLATECLLCHRAKVVVAIDIVAPPRWKGNRRTTGTKDGKGEDKEHCETGTIKCTSNQVRVVLEDSWAIVAEVELNVKPGNNLAENYASLR